jgi:ElaB/YqjD/DUF883 family membrane-anchored ribosome-binding protein
MKNLNLKSMALVALIGYGASALAMQREGSPTGDLQRFHKITAEKLKAVKAQEAQTEFYKIKSEVKKEIDDIKQNVKAISTADAQNTLNSPGSRKKALEVLSEARTVNTNVTDKIQKMLDIIDEAMPSSSMDPQQRNQEHMIMNKQLNDLTELSTTVFNLQNKIEDSLASK